MTREKRKVHVDGGGRFVHGLRQTRRPHQLLQTSLLTRWGELLLVSAGPRLVFSESCWKETRGPPSDLVAPPPPPPPPPPAVPGRLRGDEALCLRALSADFVLGFGPWIQTTRHHHHRHQHNYHLHHQSINASPILGADT